MMTGNPSLPAEAWVKPIAIVRAEVEQTGTEAAAVGSAGPIPVAIVEIIAEASTVRITRLLRNLNTIALQLPFRTLVDRYLTNYEDADFVAA